MKKILFLTALFSAFLFMSCNNKAAKTFANPIPVKFGDPFILYASDGKFYMYGTDESGLAGNIICFIAQTGKKIPIMKKKSFE